MRACNALWVVVLTLFVSYSLGQTGTSSVRGTVLDKSGAAGDRR